MLPPRRPPWLVALLPSLLLLLVLLLKLLVLLLLLPVTCPRIRDTLLLLLLVLLVLVTAVRLAGLRVVNILVGRVARMLMASGPPPWIGCRAVMSALGVRRMGPGVPRGHGLVSLMMPGSGKTYNSNHIIKLHHMHFLGDMGDRD